MIKVIKWEKTFPPINTDQDEEDVVSFKNGYGKDLPKADKFISGPNGIVPIDHYDIWVGHTNFVLEESDIRNISKTDGVEICRAISRYRFEICIGKLFDRTKVKDSISKQLCETNTNKKIFAVVKTNGKVFSVFGVSPEEVENKIKNMSGPVEYIKKSW